MVVLIIVHDLCVFVAYFFGNSLNEISVRAGDCSIGVYFAVLHQNFYEYHIGDNSIS